MTRSPFLRWGLGALAFVCALGVLRAKPWQRPQDASRRTRSDAREKLLVGFLPVT